MVSHIPIHRNICTRSAPRLKMVRGKRNSKDENAVPNKVDGAKEPKDSRLEVKVQSVTNGRLNHARSTPRKKERKINSYLSPARLPVQQSARTATQPKVDKAIKANPEPCSVPEGEKSSLEIEEEEPVVCNGESKITLRSEETKSLPNGETKASLQNGEAKQSLRNGESKSGLRNGETKPALRSNQAHITQFFPIRRSGRKPNKTRVLERQKEIEQRILSGVEEGLKVEPFGSKGRGIVTTRRFAKGEFVVEYIGDLIDMKEAREREKDYEKDPSKGCYNYYFTFQNQQYCIDATEESGYLGRLVNHSRNGNLVTKLVEVNGKPHLVLLAKHDLEPGIEVLYDYGDRSKEALEHYPWLAF